jgi:hypothetical protein
VSSGVLETMAYTALDLKALLHDVLAGHLADPDSGARPTVEDTAAMVNDLVRVMEEHMASVGSAASAQEPQKPKKAGLLKRLLPGKSRRVAPAVVEEGADAAAEAAKPKRAPRKPKEDRPKEPRKANSYSLFTKAVSTLAKGEAFENPRFVPVVNFPETSKARAVFEQNEEALREVINGHAGGVVLSEFLQDVDAVVGMRKDPKRRLGFNALVWGMCPEDERKEWFVSGAVPGAVDEMDDVE